MIKIKNLNKYFYHHKSNEIHVINDISLEFPKTGLVTIVGESGCGKTTLMNVLGGLDNFYSGLIEIDNTIIKKYNSRKIDKIRNEKIGYIFQNYLLLPQRTVYDNLMILLNMYDISLKEKDERIDYVLEAVGMLKYKKKNVSELSGGQQQRIAIARALIKSPSLILADEPTGNLDEKNTIQIMNIIKKISKNILVILVSHEKRIASSYSDYIIELTDGKVKNQKEIKEGSLYQYEDDQNIYLKEYQYKNISNDNINIDFYSNENKKINLKIVCKNGKFYIESDTDTIFIDSSSEIKLIDENKKVLNANEEILDNSFELKQLEFVKTPSLSFKEQINLAFTNLEKLKKRTRILAFPLFILIILALLCLQSVASAKFIDKQELIKMDSRLYTVHLECGNKQMLSKVHQFGFEKFYDGIMEKNENLKPVLNTPMKLYFELPDFSQISSKKYEIANFSVLPYDCLKEEQLLYGRMPTNVNEIVIEKWVLESAIKESTLSNFMDVSSFLNLKVSFKNRDDYMTIVGIADNDQNSAYLNKYIILNAFPSTMKVNSIRLISASEFKKIYDGNIDIQLNENEVVQNINYNHMFGSKTLKVNDDKKLIFNIVDYIDFKGLNYNFIISDSAYDKIFKSIAKSSFERLYFLCENSDDERLISNYIDEVKDYFASEELIATPENGFLDSADFNVVNIILSSYNEYDILLEPFLVESNKNVTSRMLVTLLVLIITILIVFFSMKSYSIKNIYDIGVYRAIGINKKSIVFVYALEILVISLKTTLIGGIICYAITNIIQGIPIIDVPIGISFDLFVVSTISLILLNIIVGVLPVIGYLKLTPSQILSKYDI